MIELDSITISAGSFVLRDVSLRVGSGEYAVLMGRTGCGKSTLLEVAAGLRSIHSGRVILACQDVTRLPPSQRRRWLRSSRPCPLSDPDGSRTLGFRSTRTTNEDRDSCDGVSLVPRYNRLTESQTIGTFRR
jgi:energy-coupling factor transporter ATP-binding protein EcfA2